MLQVCAQLLLRRRRRRVASAFSTKSSTMVSLICWCKSDIALYCLRGVCMSDVSASGKLTWRWLVVPAQGRLLKWRQAIGPPWLQSLWLSLLSWLLITSKLLLGLNFMWPSVMTSEKSSLAIRSLGFGTTAIHAHRPRRSEPSPSPLTWGAVCVGRGRRRKPPGNADTPPLPELRYEGGDAGGDAAGDADVEPSSPSRVLWHTRRRHDTIFSIAPTHLEDRKQPMGLCRQHVVTVVDDNTPKVVTVAQDLITDIVDIVKSQSRARACT